MPLPPYITHADEADDEQRYQTVFADVPGAVAAPTAALHFDEALLAAARRARRAARAASRCTWAPAPSSRCETENIAEHTDAHRVVRRAAGHAVDAIAACKARGGRVVAVGTTTVRTLESWAAQRAQAARRHAHLHHAGLRASSMVDRLVTNFHLPKSTLMMLVSAFAGYEHVMALYAHAIAQRYRFFSYGDAMLLARDTHAIHAELRTPRHRPTPRAPRARSR